MKKFLQRSVLFAICFISIIILSLCFIPNKRILNNSLYALIDKHQRLDSLKSPKIILLGGSNLSFGMDSKLLSDSMNMPVVNMGLHAGLGLKYMINEVKPSINKGDIVILSPEYHHLYSPDVFNGERVLVATLVDVYPEGIKYIDIPQFFHLIPLTFEYSVSKLLRNNAGWGEQRDEGFEAIYKRNAFNEDGDVIAHRTLPNEIVQKMIPPEKEISISEPVLNFIVDFKNYVEGEGAKLYVIPPAFQASSYAGFNDVIDKINDSFSDTGIPFVQSPTVYCFPDSMFFNSVYHLNNQGLIIRTELVVKELKQLEHPCQN